MKIPFFILTADTDSGPFETHLLFDERAAWEKKIELATDDETARENLRKILETVWPDPTDERFCDAFEAVKQYHDYFMIFEQEIDVPLASARLVKAAHALLDERASIAEPDEATWEELETALKTNDQGNEPEEFLAIAREAIVALERPDYDDQNATAAALRARLERFGARAGAEPERPPLFHLYRESDQLWLYDTATGEFSPERAVAITLDEALAQEMAREYCLGSVYQVVPVGTEPRPLLQ